MSADQKCPQCGTPLPPGALEGLCPACLLKQGAATESGVQGQSTAFEALPIEEVARLFPQLEILELIGRGGMGAIYKARQTALDRFVALKILPPQRSTGPNFAERFNREARALARLSHPNIVAVHEFGRVDNLHFFLMEYVDGVNLRQLEQACRLSPRQALEIVPQICDALQYAHDQGVVHRDIKPENVLVDRKGRVKIADFGLARILNDPPATLRLTGEGQVMGTPHYMAPEQVERPLEVDHRADIYALGVVFYEMLTGELPLGKFAPPSRKVEVDVRLDDVVLRALEKEPALRYQQASEVKTGVEQIARTAPTGKAPSAPRFAARPLPFGKLARAAVAGCAVFLAVLAIAAAVTFALPKTYVSTARVHLQRAAGPDVAVVERVFDPFFVQTEMEKIKSSAVITEVIEQLELDKRWGVWGGAALSKLEATKLLLRALNVRQTRNTSLLEVRFYSKYPVEAADVANAIAETYVKKQQGRAAIVDRAFSSSTPVRPNVPLNLALGAAVGVVLGALTFGVLAMTAFARRTKGAEASPQPADARVWKRLVAVVAALGLVGLAVLWFVWPSGDVPPNFVVIGTVTDAETGLPIAKARVADNRYHSGPGQAPQETWTDADGQFRLPTWYEEHTISASAPGYATKLQTVLTKPFRRETEAFMSFQLAPSPKAADPLAEAAESEAVSKEVPARAEPLSGKPRLQMRLVAPESDTTLPADEFPHPGDPSGQAKIRVLRDVLFCATSVVRAGLDQDPINGGPQIRIRLTEDDAKRFEKVTEENINRQLAILFDSRLLAAPVIRTRIPGGEIAIAGNFTDSEAHAIIDALNAAPLWVSQRGFRPEVEKVVAGKATHQHAIVLLDLDTGVSSTNEPFSFDTREAQRTIRDAGLDLFAVPEPTAPALLCLDMVLVPVNKGWDACTPADVSNSWPLMTRAPMTQQLLDTTAPCLFRTREEGWGVLQVVGNNENPPGVKIRYRLITKPDAPKLPTHGPTAGAIGTTACLAHWPEGTVELIAVADHDSATNSANRALWRPDGSPFLGASFTSNHRATWSHEGQSIEFVFRLELPVGASTTFDFGPAAEGVSQKHWPIQDGKRLEDHELVIVRLPKDARTINAKVGVAAEPWHKLAARHVNAGFSGRLQHGNQEWTLLFQDPVVEAGAFTRITAAHNTVQGWETRIIAVDQAGKEHPGRTSFQSTDQLAQTTGEFDNLPLSNVKEFRFEIRPFRWAEFRNISLTPGVRTAVEVAEGF
ncbi:MAG: protein kinase [Verrucomicrobiia bacterium]